MKISRIVQVGMLFCIVVSLTACLSKYKGIVNTWVGAPEKALFHQWGYPYEISKLPHGRRMYMYRTIDRKYIHRRVKPMITPDRRKGGIDVVHHAATAASGGQQGFYCYTWFNVNSKGIIESVKFKGNMCAESRKGVRRTTYWP